MVPNCWGRRCGVLPGAVMPDSRVAIVGAGPIGLAALQTASLLSPAAVFVLDVSDARLQACPPPGAPPAAPCSAVLAERLAASYSSWVTASVTGSASMAEAASCFGAAALNAMRHMLPASCSSY